MIRALVVSLAFSMAGFASAEYDLDAEFTMAPPPKPGSTADKADFRELLRLQRERSHEECDAAQDQTMMTGRNLVGPKLGFLSKAEFEALGDTIGELLDTVSEVAKPFKKQYSRARPYEADDRIQPCITLPGGQTSYPSSHAASGVVLGHFLKAVFPSRASEAEQLGWQVGQNRLIGGVHHPSDVDAGRDLGEQIWEALQTHRQFKKDLSAAKTAVR